MPNPARSDVHVNAPLTQISIAHLQSADAMVSTQLFPLLPVQRQADLYWQYAQEDFWRGSMQKRAPGTESAGAGYGLSTAAYNCDVFALHRDIDDQIRANTDSPLDMDRDAAQFLTQQFLIKRDADFASAFFQPSTWTGSTTGSDIVPSTKWDASGATPIIDIEKQINSVQLKTGMRPNRLLLGIDALSALVNSADCVERIKYTQRGIVTEDMLAGMLGVSKVVVARGIQNTAVEGATAAYSRIFTSDSALLCYAADTPSLMQPSAGYTFSWANYGGSGADGQRMSRFRMDHLRSDRIEIEAAYDMKIVSAACGAFFTSVDT